MKIENEFENLHFDGQFTTKTIMIFLYDKMKTLTIFFSFLIQICLTS